MIVNLEERYYSYDKLIADAKSLEDNYSSILHCVTIGKSHDNRDIVLLKLGIGQKYMICCAGVHARENINPIVIMSIIEYYADLYVNHKEQKVDLMNRLYRSKVHLKSEYENMVFGACIYELLQTFTILFVPLLNPDGYMISIDGFDAISNLELRQKCISKGIPSAEWKFNARAVDINRNFPSRLWRQKDPEDYAASENETKALIYLFHMYKTRGFLDFHSRGNEIYYYRREMSNSYNEKQFKIVNRLKDITGYTVVPPEEEIDPGDTGGNTVHYYAEHFYKPAITVETVDEIAGFPLDYHYRVPVFDKLKLLIFEFGSLII